MKATRGPAAARPLRWALAAIAAACLPRDLPAASEAMTLRTGRRVLWRRGSRICRPTPASRSCVPTRFDRPRRADRGALGRWCGRAGGGVAASGSSWCRQPSSETRWRSGRWAAAASSARRRCETARPCAGRCRRASSAAGAASAGESDGALLWKQGSAYGAVKGDDVVLAHSRDDIEQALDAGAGSDSMAFDDAVLGMLARLGDDVPARLAGDAQRLLGSDPRSGGAGPPGAMAALARLLRRRRARCSGRRQGRVLAAQQPGGAVGRRPAAGAGAGAAPACTTRARARPSRCWRRTAWPASSNRCWG